MARSDSIYIYKNKLIYLEICIPVLYRYGRCRSRVADPNPTQSTQWDSVEEEVESVPQELRS